MADMQWGTAACVLGGLPGTFYLWDLSRGCDMAGFGLAAHGQINMVCAQVDMRVSSGTRETGGTCAKARDGLHGRFVSAL